MQHACKLLVVLSVACASSAVAAPDTPAPPAAPPAGRGPGCRAGGPVVFEIDHRIEPGAKLPTSAIKVFATGAWTREETDADGKALAARDGCMPKQDVKELRSTLHGAPWKVTTAK